MSRPRSAGSALLLPFLALPLAGCPDPDDGANALVINEFMASNASVLADANGAYPDWIEIRNLGSDEVSLEGWAISDEATEPGRAPLSSALAVQGGGHLLLFADGDVQEGDDHLPFRLSAGGEDLVLSFDAGSGYESVDGLSFGAQETDVSQARQPDGTGEWEADASPTPGEPND